MQVLHDLWSLCCERGGLLLQRRIALPPVAPQGTLPLTHRKVQVGANLTTYTVVGRPTIRTENLDRKGLDLDDEDVGAGNQVHQKEEDWDDWRRQRVQQGRHQSRSKLTSDYARCGVWAVNSSSSSMDSSEESPSSSFSSPFGLSQQEYKTSPRSWALRIIGKD